MRIVTWNVRWVLERRWELLDRLQPDIAVIPEARHWARSGLPIPEPLSRPEIGGRLMEGDLLVEVRRGWRMARDETADATLERHIVVSVSGPAEFDLVALVARPDGSRQRRYLQRIEAIIDANRHRITAGRCLVVGDFNVEPRRGATDHRGEFVELIESMDLVSAYHVHTGEDFGEETRPTHHHVSGNDFHIDMCLLPAKLASTVRSVGVGDPGGSDHRPLIVDLDWDAAPLSD